MNIIVCVKQVLDPNLPPAKFRIDAKAKRVIPPEGIPLVINPYDEQAVELALRLKEKHGGKITILSLGDKEATGVIKHALSLGADEGILLSDEAFEGSDSFSIAYILTKAIEKISNYDLILCGRQAADWDEGLVGTMIAENLGLPLVTLAKEIEVVEGGLKVKRVTLEGYQVFVIPLPALVTVSNEAPRPRLPSGWGIISATRKQIPLWKAEDIGADLTKVGAKAERRKLAELSLPKRERKGEIVEGETAEEIAEKLVGRLREVGAI